MVHITLCCAKLGQTCPAGEGSWPWRHVNMIIKYLMRNILEANRAGLTEPQFVIVHHTGSNSATMLFIYNCSAHVARTQVSKLARLSSTLLISFRVQSISHPQESNPSSRSCRSCGGCNCPRGVSDGPCDCLSEPMTFLHTSDGAVY